MGAIIKPRTPNKQEEVTCQATDTNKTDINIIHEQLGHPSNDTTIKTCKKLGIPINGKINTCLHCKLSKIIKTKISKETINKAIKPMERLFIDITPFTVDSFSGKRNWLLIVDEATKFKWSLYLTKKAKHHQQ